MFYKDKGGDLVQFIKETDHRERLDKKLPRQTIPLGPQGEDDAA